MTNSLERTMRSETVCRGCGGPKDQLCIVCWGCFKYERKDEPDFTPLKYFTPPMCPEPDWHNGAMARAWYDSELAEWLRRFGAKAKSMNRHLAEAAAFVDSAEFRLANDPPRHKPAEFDSNTAKQKALLAGLDCLSGQRDLFPTDGESES